MSKISIKLKLFDYRKMKSMAYIAIEGVLIIRTNFHYCIFI